MKVLPILSILFLSCFHGAMTPELHILPDGYIGEVKILYNQRNSSEFNFFANIRTLYIPNNGILKTSSNSNLGWIDAKNDLKFRYSSEAEFLTNIISIPEDLYGLDSSLVIIYDYGYVTNTDSLGIFTEYSIYIIDSFKNTNFYQTEKSSLYK